MRNTNIKQQKENEEKLLIEKSQEEKNTENNFSCLNNFNFEKRNTIIVNKVF